MTAGKAPRYGANRHGHVGQSLAAGSGHVSPWEAVRILLVEDQQDLRDLLKSGLERRGITVMAYADSDGAREALRSSQGIDVVVTDATLREVDDGLDLARDIRDSQPEIPVVVVSGSRDVVQRARQVGASVVLEKPITARALATAIETVAAGPE